MAKRRCAAKTKAGKRCRNAAVQDGKCLAHLPRKVKVSRGFGGPQPGSGRPPKPRVVDVMRERVEAEIDEILRPYFEQLTGAVVHATFRGDVFPSSVPDTGARIEAAERLLDRVYGKPRQAIEATGEGGGPVQIAAELFANPETRKVQRDLVREAGRARRRQSRGSGASD